MPLIKNKLYGGIHDMLEQYNDILSVEELCELLHVGRNRVYQLLQSGELKGFRLGKTWKIPKIAVEEYIRSSII
ncbi:MAG: helix-turn-helix domain-containing protein [Enterocloster sp.]